ncbi:MAG: hypothetical protein C0524_02365 [Rhodobacter sp.]|nr:hypothetical protein [Rhodobacter sp.]
MKTNAVPHYDDSDNTTGCCPRFNPKGWDGQKLHFVEKDFVRATTRSAMHIPLNMGRVFARVQGKIEDAGGTDPDNCIVLSRDLSPWESEHLFSFPAPLPNEETVTLTGDFITRVFEGPYREAKTWHAEMQAEARKQGGSGDDVYFFYTTCPKCAKAYGKNYVVGVARTA